MERIDMHIHTTRSDGILTPSEVVKWAVKLRLKGIAITDHDTVDGIQEAMETASVEKKIHIIPGIEFSTLYKEKEVHILGYFIDYENEELVSLTELIKKHRANRAKEMIQRLKKFNIHIEESFISHDEGHAIGRLHIAKALMKKGYVKSAQEAFNRYLIPGRPGYVSRFKISIEEAVEIIKKANGIPALAHPGLLDQSLDVIDIINKGVMGMEVYHSKHSKEESEDFLSLAKKKNLIITGGTDFHDQFIEGIPVLGSIGVSFDSIKEYIE